MILKVKLTDSVDEALNSGAASYFPATSRNDAEMGIRENRDPESPVPMPSLNGGQHQTQDCVQSENRTTAGDFNPGSSLPDETLLNHLHAGDREALAVLFRRFARVVRTVAWRILRDESEADDLLQEVFLFIFRKAALFDASRGSARSWIVQVTYHRAIDRRRYLNSRRFYSNLDFEDSTIGNTELGTEIAFYEQSMEGRLGTAMLKKIDEALSEDQRRIIRLHFFEGYSLEEIAGRTAQSLGNVRNHYYRGLDRMRQIVFSAKLQAK
jgi:RNA polymerase sigma-70 factor (ECF subfamily)